jgi:hypothetical protein
VCQKERPSREGWKAVPPTLPRKGRVRGEVLILFLPPMCQVDTFFYEVNLVLIVGNLTLTLVRSSILLLNEFANSNLMWRFFFHKRQRRNRFYVT